MLNLSFNMCQHFVECSFSKVLVTTQNKDQGITLRSGNKQRYICPSCQTVRTKIMKINGHKQTAETKEIISTSRKCLENSHSAVSSLMNGKKQEISATRESGEEDHDR